MRFFVQPMKTKNFKSNIYWIILYSIYIFDISYERKLVLSKMFYTNLVYTIIVSKRFDWSSPQNAATGSTLTVVTMA